MLVVDASAPLIRLFSRAGEPIAAWGRLGEGPGELGRPWRAHVADDSLFILGDGRLTVHSLVRRAEINRAGALPGIMSLSHACGDLTALYQVQDPSGVVMARYTIARWDGNEGSWRTEARGAPSPFLPVGFTLRAVPYQGGLLLFNPGRRSLEHVRCSDDGASPVVEDALSGWRAVPELRGHLLLGDSTTVLAFIKGRETAAVTDVLRLNLEDGTRSMGSLEGIWRLEAHKDDMLWLIDDDVGAAVVAVPLDTFLTVLGVGGR